MEGRTLRAMSPGLVAFGCLLLPLANGCGVEDDDGVYVPLSTLDDTEVEVDGAFTYSISDDESLIYVQILAVPGTSGHDHVIRATDYSGTATFDSDDISACSVSIPNIPVRSLQADEDFMRERVGYDESLSAATQSSVESTMNGESQLDASSYPTMGFTSTGCEEIEGGLRITGDMTLHGQTRSKTIDFEAYTTAAGFVARGTLTFTQSEFGIEPYKLLGTYENADEGTMTFDITAIRDE